MSGDPDLGALLAEAIAFARGSINVALPATVLSYNPTLQTITAKPSISGRRQDPETGALLPFPFPAVANIPVLFPSGSVWALTGPLAPGDPVLLIVADRSTDEWRATGAQECVPLDTRRFDWSDAYAIPGGRPTPRPIPPTGVSPTAVVLEGADIRAGSSAATSPVALAPLVAAVFAELKVWLDTHTHPAPGGATSAPAVLSPTPGNVAATKLKAE